MKNTLSHVEDKNKLVRKNTKTKLNRQAKLLHCTRVEYRLVAAILLHG